MKCAICKRVITDPQSMKIGIGPVCRGKYGVKGIGRQDNLLFENHAVFSIASENDSFVYIIDRGNNSNAKSVTNDAEWVVSELCELCQNFDKKRLFYMDSCGNIDEIIHIGKTFISFKHGHEGVSL